MVMNTTYAYHPQNLRKYLYKLKPFLKANVYNNITFKQKKMLNKEIG